MSEGQRLTLHARTHCTGSEVRQPEQHARSVGRWLVISSMHDLSSAPSGAGVCEGRRRRLAIGSATGDSRVLI